MQPLGLVCYCALAAVVAAAPRQKGNPYFHSCRYRSRLWDDCLQNVAQELRPVLVEGIPELGVRPIDPLHVDLLSFNEVSGKFGIRMQMINVTMEGLRDYIVTGVRSNLAQLSIELRLRVPKLTFQSYYHMDGSFLISAISGGGVCQFNFSDVDNKIVINGHLVRRVSDDALHFRVAALRWTMLRSKGSAHFSKLAGADSVQSHAATLLLNEHWEEAWSSFQGAAEVAFGEVFRERINRLLMKMPYRELFPPGIPPLHLLQHPIDDTEADEYPPIKWVRPTTTTSTTAGPVYHFSQINTTPPSRPVVQVPVDGIPAPNEVTSFMPVFAPQQVIPHINTTNITGEVPSLPSSSVGQTKSNNREYQTEEVESSSSTSGGEDVGHGGHISLTQKTTSMVDIGHGWVESAPTFEQKTNDHKSSITDKISMPSSPSESTFTTATAKIDEIVSSNVTSRNSDEAIKSVEDVVLPRVPFNIDSTDSAAADKKFSPASLEISGIHDPSASPSFPFSGSESKNTDLSRLEMHNLKNSWPNNVANDSSGDKIIPSSDKYEASSASEDSASLVRNISTMTEPDQVFDIGHKPDESTEFSRIAAFDSDFTLEARVDPAMSSAAPEIAMERTNSDDVKSRVAFLVEQPRDRFVDVKQTSSGLTIRNLTAQQEHYGDTRSEYTVFQLTKDGLVEKSSAVKDEEVRDIVTLLESGDLDSSLKTPETLPPQEIPGTTRESMGSSTITTIGLNDPAYQTETTKTIVIPEITNSGTKVEVDTTEETLTNDQRQHLYFHDRISQQQVKSEDGILLNEAVTQAINSISGEKEAVTEATMSNLVEKEDKDIIDDQMTGIEESVTAGIQNDSTFSPYDDQTTEVSFRDAEGFNNTPSDTIDVAMIGGYFKEAVRTFLTEASEVLSSALKQVDAEDTSDAAEMSTGAGATDAPSGRYRRDTLNDVGKEERAGEVRVETELTLLRPVIVSPWPRTFRTTGQEVTTLNVTSA